MNLSLVRLYKTPEATCGKLSVNGVYECFTLELPVVDGLPGSAIPEGTYPIILSPSPKFQASTDKWVLGFANQMPHLQNIPNRSLIMIHWGNSPNDTEGCILVGKTHSPNLIGFSRVGFEALFSKIKAALTNGEAVSIQITSK